MTGRIVEGSVLSFTPADGYVVKFDLYRDGTLTESWESPLIGWAVVVVHTGEDGTIYETALQPVALDEGRPVVPRGLQLDLDCGVVWDVKAAP